MFKTKKAISTLIASVMLVSSIGMNAVAEDYIYPDTEKEISGIEVFDQILLDDGHRWMPSRFDNDSSIYLTHEAYDGNAALLIVPPEVDGNSWVTSYNLDKASQSNSDADKVIEGHEYKIVWYAKPVEENTNGVYSISTFHRYYDNYDSNYAKIYDPESGEEITDGVYENKWYRCETEFTANSSMASSGYGFALNVNRQDHSVQIIDKVEMYHKIDGNYVLMKDGTGVRNGNFEEGVAAVKGVNPTGVYAQEGDGTVTIRWTNPQEQETRIYNGSDLVATADVGETSATVDGLENNTAYTFTLKGVLNGLESSGVNVSFTPHEEVWQYSDTIATVAGVEVFKSNQSSDTNLHFPNWQNRYQVPGVSAAELYLTHDSYHGNAAMLVKADPNTNFDLTNVGLNKSGSENPADRLVQGDTYKLEMYQKPIERGTDGKYSLNTGIRYYDNYDAHTLTAYDIETNSTADLNNLQSKWYRLEVEFVAGSETNGNNGGLALWPEAGFPVYLVDGITMYHKIDGEWVAMADGTAVSNGDFESGVETAFGLDPTDVEVENKTESVVLSWTNPQEQKTNVYNGSELVMTAEAGASSATITNLTGDVEYTFTLKGVGSQRESDGVSVTAFPYKRLADTTDIVSGLEVFRTGAPHWLTTYQDTNSTLYLTHEAYEGNAALLIVPPGNANSYPANYELSKALEGNDDADKVISGDTYKIIWYAKPIAQNSNGVYMISNAHRYYNRYDVFEAKVYDAETGEEITDGVYENKWYRCESEFTANDANVDQWVGFALRVASETSVQLIDNLEMYHMVNDEWHLMKDVTGVRNGNFEEGVVGDDTAPYEVENFGAVAGDAQAQLSWDKVEVDDLAGYTIWNGSDKIADLDRTATSYTATGLDNDTEYTFIIRAYDRFGNSSEGTPVSVTPTTPEYEIGEFNMGQTIVSGTNSVSVSVTNNKKADGLNAQLILGLYDKASNTLVKAAASEVVTTAVGESNTLTAALSVEDLNAADYELKAFLWESLDSVSPLTAGASIGE